MSSDFVFGGIEISIKVYRHYFEISTISFPLKPSSLKALNPRDQVYVNDGVFCCSLSDLGSLAYSSPNEPPVFTFNERRFCSIFIAKVLELAPDDGFPNKFSDFVNAAHLEAIKLANLVRG